MGEWDDVVDDEASGVRPSESVVDGFAADPAWRFGGGDGGAVAVSDGGVAVGHRRHPLGMGEAPEGESGASCFWVH